MSPDQHDQDFVETGQIKLNCRGFPVSMGMRDPCKV